MGRGAGIITDLINPTSLGFSISTNLEFISDLQGDRSTASNTFVHSAHFFFLRQFSFFFRQFLPPVRLLLIFFLDFSILEFSIHSIPPHPPAFKMQDVG